MAATTSLLTFEDLERMPDEPNKIELLDGELIRLPPPKKKHMMSAHRFYELLKPWVRQRAGFGEVYLEMGYRFGQHSWLVPDVSIEHPGQPGEDYLKGAPVLAIEIISKSNTADQMDRKVKTYLANGGQEVWVVYPKTRCVWVFSAGGAREFRGTLRSELLPGLEIDLEAVFG
jgi:Uma2 family endonuclease